MNIFKVWKTYKFEIILSVCIGALLLLALYNYLTNKKGTWSTKQYYSPYAKERVYEPKTHQQKRQGGDSKGEIECRRVLEKMFNKPFDKVRPDFLRNPVTGGNFNLELDCYNHELGIAVEYNGAQHYKYTPYFHKNKEAFLNQKYRDDMKRRICKENNIYLLEVPYTIPHEDIEKYIKNNIMINK